LDIADFSNWKQWVLVTLVGSLAALQAVRLAFGWLAAFVLLAVGAVFVVASFYAARRRGTE
jgi:hypothetical protein